MSEAYRFSGYTRRLYESPLRFIHALRARRIVRLLAGHSDLRLARRVLELGCSDLYFLSRFASVGFCPQEYVGIDIFWEDTMVQARHNARLLHERHAIDVSLMNQHAEAPFGRTGFDAVIALETLEHLEDEERVVENLDSAIADDGLLLLSLPVEFGAMLLVKELARMVLKRKVQYSARELAAAALGQTSKVRRVTGDHKGYDYRLTLDRLRKRRFVPLQEHLYPFPHPHIAYGYIGLWKKRAG